MRHFPLPPPLITALHAKSAAQRRTVANTPTSGEVRSYGFPKFESLLEPPAVGSQNSERPLSWLMRVMEDIYDARFTHDSAEFVQNVDNDASAAADRPGRMSDIFPVFCYDYFAKKYGLKPLVERNAHELLRCVEAKRGDHLEVQIFARFLEEYYDADDILFFLYVRSIIMKESGINFRIRWSEGAGRSPRESLWLSYRACQLVSRTVFMSERDPLYVAFMRTVDEHLIGGLTTKEDTRRIEVATFLQLALQEYHECRPVAGDAPPPTAAASKQQERLFRDAERDYERSQAKADQVQRQNEKDALELKQQQRAAYDAASRPLPAAASRGAPNISPGGNAGKPKVHVSRHGSISISMGGGALGGGDAGRGGGADEDEDEDARSMAGSVSSTSSRAAKAQLQRKIDDVIAKRALAYTEALLASSCSGLPREVVVEIRAEVRAQLDKNLKAVLDRVVEMSTAPTHVQAREPRWMLPLLRSYRAVCAAYGTSGRSLIPAYADEVISSPAVKDDVEPLISLLTTFATQRLAGGGR